MGVGTEIEKNSWMTLSDMRGIWQPAVREDTTSELELKQKEAISPASLN